MKGSYILLLKLHKPRRIPIGKLGILDFTKGFYAYVGSALNGLEARVSRHFKLSKKHHWHIDYLLDWADIYETVLIPSEVRLECTLVRALNEELPCIRGFGSSDCDCHGHLFYTYSKIKLNTCINNTLTKLGITCYYKRVPASNCH